MERLEYVFASNRRALSTNPLQSDSVVNLAHMEHLVGTLIKQGPSGRYEPYLAESWEVNDAQSVWTFHLRDDIKCEDGEEINAETFKGALERNITSYATHPLPVIQDLKGFDQFIKSGGELPGIVANGKSLTFVFDLGLKTGVLEFLSMPYYGYYCSSNYTAESTWKSDREIVSSGSYSLEKISDDLSTITLRLRKSWFANGFESPRTAVVTQMTLKEALTPSSANRIVFGYKDPLVSVPEGMIEVKSTPDILVAIVLSPFMDNLFKDRGNRIVYKNKLRQAQAKLKFPEGDDELSDFFYPYARSEVKRDIDVTEFSVFGHKRLRAIVSDHLHSSQLDYLDRLFADIFRGSGVEVEVEKIDRSNPNWMEDYRSNKKYDIRVAGVSIGGSFQNWVIDMMFCSKLGVSFPDPSGRICSLVKQFDRSDLSIERYAGEFNQILSDDSSVIPLFHRRYSWFVSEGVDYSLSPVAGAPRFEAIRSK